MKKSTPAILLLAFIIPALSGIISFPGSCIAAAGDHAENLSVYGILSPRSAGDTVFSPILHSNISPANPSFRTLAGVMMPFFYFLNEKYPLYPEDSLAGDNKDQSLKKYLQKAPKMAWKYICVSFSGKFLSPFNFFLFDIISNFGSSFLTDRLLSSYIASKVPCPVTVMSPAGVDSYLTYAFIEASEYSVYLIYSPFEPPISNQDLYSRILVFDKSVSRFFIFSRQRSVTFRDPVLALFIHDFTLEYKNLDRFDKLFSGSYGFRDAFNYLRLQIEKKVISSEERLKRYRLYNFLPRSMKNELATLMKTVKISVSDPLPAAYIDNYSRTNPLQIEMNMINQREQEKAVLKRFVSVGEKFSKLKISLVPRKEFDLVFKKIPLK